MGFRRLVRRLLVPAACVLPVWIVLATITVEPSVGHVLGALVTAPLAFAGMLIVALMTRVRPSVRENRAVSWRDVAIHLAWWALLIAYGVPTAATAVLGVLAAVLGVVALGNAAVRMTREARERVATAWSSVSSAAGHPEPRREHAPLDGGVMIVLPQDGDEKPERH